MATTGATSPLAPLYDPAYLAEPVPWANRKASFLGIVVSATSISAICVLWRLYVRLWVVRSPGWDDLFVGLYLATTIVSFVAVVMEPDSGLGQHVALLSPQTIRSFLFYFYVANASYVSSTAFMKLSLLFQYLRLYTPATPLHRLCVVLIVIISMWGIGFSFIAWFPCFPVRLFWDYIVGFAEGYCYGFAAPLDRTTYILHTGSNMVFDVLIFAIPMTLPFDKSTPVKQRIGMAVLLFLGVLVNVVAAWRLILLTQNTTDVRVIFDGTWNGAPGILLASIETNLASICASVPIFWPVLSRRLEMIFVTKEVEVNYEDRGGNGSEVELNVKDGIASEGSNVCPKKSGWGNGNWTHYEDDYIRDQVDPLRPSTAAGFEARIQGEPAKKKKKAWF